MKTKFFVLIACSLLLLVAGCKQKPDEPELENLVGTVEKPTWTAPEEYDMATSMTAVVRVDLALSYKPEQLTSYQPSADDLLAAFSGETCLGVGVWGDDLAYLYINAPEDNGDVTLRYYAASLKNIFTAAPVPFSNDDQLGTVEAPHTPTWTVKK